MCPARTPSDPKSQAEAKYRWLKESVAYLEALKEFDRKSYNSFEKSVTSSIVREFVSKAPPRYDKEFKLPDGNDKALCGETFGDIRDRLAGYESECWSTLNAGCKTVGTREFTKTVDGKEMKIRRVDLELRCALRQGPELFERPEDVYGTARVRQQPAGLYQRKAAGLPRRGGRRKRQAPAGTGQENQGAARVPALQTIPGICRPQ